MNQSRKKCNNHNNLTNQIFSNNKIKLISQKNNSKGLQLILVSLNHKLQKSRSKNILMQTYNLIYKGYYKKENI